MLEERVVAPIRMLYGTAGQLLYMELVDGVFLTSLFLLMSKALPYLPVTKSSEKMSIPFLLRKLGVFAVVE